MSTINNAIDAANQPQTFGGACTFTNATHILSGLATATTADVVYINPSTGLLTQGAAPGGSSGFTSINIQKFTTSGTYTPTSGMLYCIIEAVGGGGGGGGISYTGTQYQSAAGGGAGGYARLLASAATIGASQSITIGAAGAGGTSAGAGTAGGNTTVGSLITCNGGSGGAGSSSTSYIIAAGGAGGTATGGTVNVQGQPGNFGYGAVTLYAVVGTGGSTLLGAGGVSNQFNLVPATPVGYGGGGCGVYGTSAAGTYVGGPGAAGVVIITEFI